MSQPLKTALLRDSFLAGLVLLGALIGYTVTSASSQPSAASPDFVAMPTTQEEPTPEEQPQPLGWAVTFGHQSEPYDAPVANFETRSGEAGALVGGGGEWGGITQLGLGQELYFDYQWARTFSVLNVPGPNAVGGLEPTILIAECGDHGEAHYRLVRVREGGIDILFTSRWVDNHDRGVRFHDMDDDGICEIMIRDSVFASYQFFAPTRSPRPTIYLAWDAEADRYRVANNRFQRAVLAWPGDERSLEEILARCLDWRNWNCRDYQSLIQTFYGTMASLLWAGLVDEALALAADFETGREPNKIDLTECSFLRYARASVWWDDLVEVFPRLAELP